VIGKLETNIRAVPEFCVGNESRTCSRSFSSRHDAWIEGSDRPSKPMSMIRKTGSGLWLCTDGMVVITVLPFSRSGSVEVSFTTIAEEMASPSAVDDKAERDGGLRSLLSTIRLKANGTIVLVLPSGHHLELSSCACAN
jgi:hypothetical protein